MSVLNIDPDAAAQHYRSRVVEQLGWSASDEEVATVREQLSGACTTEIATFDEFANLLSKGGLDYDHVVFDTAPTGHTLRLLSLPKAWSGFLAGNDRGASCLGPHSGLKMQEQLFNQALVSLNDASLTSVVLVARPETGALREAARTAGELRELGLTNQRLVVNAMFKATDRSDAIAVAIEALGQQAMDEMPAALREMVIDTIPLRAVDSVGLPALRKLLSPNPTELSDTLPETIHFDHHRLAALGLVKLGKSVQLSTTDPAAHLAATLEGAVPGLTVGRIDPKAETQKYVDKIVAAKSPGMSPAEVDLLIEDLRSPCTEEVAVFHAFSHVVSQARSSCVVLDTAPTGHSLLLMDATSAYHRQMVREFESTAPGRIVTPLMRLQDADYTKIVLVTLPEATPVSQAAALQDDLRRAKIEPFAWVVNKSLLATQTQDPLLRARLEGERKQVERVMSHATNAVYTVPWTSTPPVGVSAVEALL
jgi:arsenite-transporting ATPase